MCITTSSTRTNSTAPFASARRSSRRASRSATTKKSSTGMWPAATESEAPMLTLQNRLHKHDDNTPLCSFPRIQEARGFGTKIQHVNLLSDLSRQNSPQLKSVTLLRSPFDASPVRARRPDLSVAANMDYLTQRDLIVFSPLTRVNPRNHQSRRDASPRRWPVVLPYGLFDFSWSPIHWVKNIKFM